MSNQQQNQIAQRMEPVKSAFAKYRQKLEIATPPGVNPQKVVQSVLMEVSKTPSLLQCNPISLVDSVLKSLTLGLLPGKLNGELSYLVPFGNTVNLIIGYRGWQNLAFRSGFLIVPKLIRDGDFYEQHPGTLSSTHRPMANSDETVIGAYAVVKHKADFIHSDPVWQRELQAIRDRQLGMIKNERARAESPWAKYPESMYLKTPIIRVAKYLPLASQEWAMAQQLDEAAEAGQSQQFILGDYQIADEDMETMGGVPVERIRDEAA